MSNSIYSIITGTGSYIPFKRVKNEAFLLNKFYDTHGNEVNKTNEEIISKFQKITTINERRYVSDDLVTSDIAYFASMDAIKSADINKEELDYIILAHNFGDVRNDNKQLDIVPSLAARVKYKLEIKNPETVAYDLPFGCPGWLQALIQADYFIKSGDAKKILIIGADVLSRVSDPHDRDSMIYSDGAGAVVVEAKKSDSAIGILAHKTRSDTFEFHNLLFMGKSNKPGSEFNDEFFLKMNGKKVYQYALEMVPIAIKACLDKINLTIRDIKKVFIHQANGKMDEAIIKRLYKLYNILEVPDNIMPMSIEWLGNSSVATIPTLLNLVLTNSFEKHSLLQGDTIVFASVGAGMNINTIIYKF